jgi:iron complex transport system substrate-binding protein
MRIASLAPSITEILYELGAENDIVCSTIFCDYPEAAKSLPKVGSFLNLDIQKLKAFAPDLVLTSSLLQGPLTAELRAQGFQVININPTRLIEVVESYNQIGQLAERVARAEDIALDLYKKIMAYRIHPLSAPAFRVYCEEWQDPPMVAGNWVPDLVELAGGQAGLVASGERGRQFSLEELVSFDPQIIILHVCGLGEKVNPAAVMSRPGWERLSAVQNQRIYVLDDCLMNRPTGRLFMGLKKLREILIESQE